MNVDELLKGVTNGSIVLPDFQRSFVWEPEDVRELIVSILGDFFIGSFLILESFKHDALFALKLMEGVQQVNKAAEVQSMVKILLDGQQRATAILYALEEPNIPLKNRKNPYKTYLNLEKALAGEWDAAVLTVNVADKKTLNQIKDNSNIISLKLLKDIEELVEKFKADSRLPKIVALANRFMHRYDINIVKLPENTTSNKIVETFERVNRTGEPLSLFDLVTARLYKHKIKLRDLWQSAQEEYDFAKFIPADYMLRLITLLRGKGTKRQALLDLKPKNFKEDWRRACTAMEVAYQRTTSLKKGYGVFAFKKWIPYLPMLVPLAGLIDFLRNRKLEQKEHWDKIDCWYWTSIFATRYDEGAVSKQGTDFSAIQDWVIDKKKVPDFIQESDFSKIDLDVDKQNSATYRGVIALCVLEGALDFETGQPPPFDEKNVQDDHIFPKSIYSENRIANRTLITTNPKKGDKKPSVYFGEKLKKYKEKELKRILKSHLIPDEALKFLLTDDIQRFTEARRKEIIQNIERRISLPR